MLRIIICLCLVLLPLGAAAQDVSCQYDCLAKGGLPEACDSKCGMGSAPAPAEDGDGSSAGGRTGGAEEMLMEDGSWKAIPKEEKPAPKKKSKPKPKSQEETYSDDFDFACIKKCREADNSLKDCKSLCLGE